MVAMLMKRMPKSDVYHRRHDGVVLEDRQMLVKMQPTGDRAALLKQLGLSKRELLAELAKSTPAGQGKVNWES